jgi:hypothetical protein
MTIMETLTYQHQPENWLYEIKQKGNSQTCYVMVQNAKVCISIPLPPPYRAKIRVLSLLSIAFFRFSIIIPNDMRALESECFDREREKNSLSLDLLLIMCFCCCWKKYTLSVNDNGEWARAFLWFYEMINESAIILYQLFCPFLTLSRVDVDNALSLSREVKIDLLREILVRSH